MCPRRHRLRGSRAACRPRGGPSALLAQVPPLPRLCPLGLPASVSPGHPHAQPLLQQPHPQTPGTSLPASRTACVLPLCVSFRASSTSLPHPVCPGPTTGTASAIRAPGPLRILFRSHPLPCPLTLPSLWKSYVILCSGTSLLTKPRPLLRGRAQPPSLPPEDAPALFHVQQRVLCSKWDTGVGETWPCPQDLRDTGCTES